MSNTLEVPIALIEKFTKLFESKNNKMENLIAFRESNRSLSDERCGQLLLMIDENKNGIFILNNILRDLKSIQEDL